MDLEEEDSNGAIQQDSELVSIAIDCTIVVIGVPVPESNPEDPGTASADDPLPDITAAAASAAGDPLPDITAAADDPLPNTTAAADDPLPDTTAADDDDPLPDTTAADDGDDPLPDTTAADDGDDPLPDTTATDPLSDTIVSDTIVSEPTPEPTVQQTKTARTKLDTDAAIPKSLVQTLASLKVQPDSLEASLKKFCTPELLTDANKFACVVCTKLKYELVTTRSTASKY